MKTYKNNRYRKMGSDNEKIQKQNYNESKNNFVNNSKIVKTVANKNQINIQGSKINVSNLSKDNYIEGYKEFFQSFQNFKNRAESYITQICEELKLIKKENVEMKEEIKNLRILLENKNKINNRNNKNEEWINIISEKISNQNLEFKQLFESIKSQINNIQNNIDNNPKKNKQIYQQKEIYENNEQKLESKYNNVDNNKIKNNEIKNQKKNFDLEKIINIFKTKKNKEKNNFHYFKLNEKLESELLETLINSINFNQNEELNINQTFDRQEVEKKNQDIYSKIKKHLATYKRNQENYMLKRATFLKEIGLLVRFSHEIANYLLSILLIIFKEIFGFHSLEEETIRLNFASWIKKAFNEQYFIEIANSQKILSQIEELMKKDENNLYKEMLPKIIQLYFICYLTDMKVDIIYAKEDDEFDFDTMVDDLISDSEIERKVLFTFLPGLFSNNQFFNYSTIHVVTYKIDNPNKFPFQKPIFANIGYKIQIDLIKEIKKFEIFYEKKDLKNGNIIVEFNVVTEPDIKWDHPKFEFVLLDCNNYVIKNLVCREFKECNYQRCICKMLLNDKVAKISNPIILDLTKKTNKYS